MDWGYMGKVPSRGDFICNNIEPELRDIFFEWCQSGLAVSREQLGDNWNDAYLTSPVWCFACGPGSLSKSGHIGALIPSVDKVGRYFPFITLKSYSGNALQAWSEPSWRSEIQSLILDALDDHWLEAQWQQRLQGISIPSGSTRQIHWPKEQGNVVFPEKISEQEILHSFISKEGSPMLWWTEGSAYVDPVMLLTYGLPQVGQFAAMLASNWQDHGWQHAALTE